MRNLNRPAAAKQEDITDERNPAKGRKKTAQDSLPLSAHFPLKKVTMSWIYDKKFTKEEIRMASFIIRYDCRLVLLLPGV